MDKSLSFRFRAVGAASLLLLLAATGGEAQEWRHPIPAAPGALSVERNTIREILANPAGRQVIFEHAPNLLHDPGLDRMMGMTLGDISLYPQSLLDYGKLLAIQKALDAVRR